MTVPLFLIFVALCGIGGEFHALNRHLKDISAAKRERGEGRS